MKHEKLIEKHLGANTPYWIKEKVDNAINEALQQTDVSGLLKDRLFQLANDFAVDKQGDVAVKLHSIHNGL